MTGTLNRLNAPLRSYKCNKCKYVSSVRIWKPALRIRCCNPKGCPCFADRVYQVKK